MNEKDIDAIATDAVFQIANTGSTAGSFDPGRARSVILGALCSVALLENCGINLNGMAAGVRYANDKWWRDPKTGQPIQRNKGELQMLIVSEIAEAMEGSRKDLMDDKLPHRKMEEVEMADAVIRILDYCGGFGLDLHGAVMEKLAYNRTRADHTHEARLAANGKKF